MILVICTGRYFHSHWWSWWFVLEDIFTATDDPGDLYWKIFSQPLMILVICTGRYFHSPLSRSVRFILLVLLYFGQPVDKNECINQVLHKINFDEQSPSILFVHGIITLHYEVNTTRLHLRTYSNALNTVISPHFLVWKFSRKEQLPPSLGPLRHGITVFYAVYVKYCEVLRHFM